MESGLFCVVRGHSIRRQEQGKQKAADLHQAGGWYFQLENFCLPLGHIGGLCFTSMAPWRLTRQVAVSYFQTAPDAWFRRYQTAPRPSSGDIMLWTFGPEAGDLTTLGQSRRRKMA